MKDYFLASEIPQGRPHASQWHIIPVPYEKSVSYGHGTALGPQAIIEASNQLELLETRSQTCPGLKGIYTQEAINCHNDTESILEDLEKATYFALENNAIPVILGGEHTVSFGAIKACHKKYPDMGIIHFDAHADLRFAYEGNKWSHASVMHRVLELNIPLAQYGTRAYCKEEKEVREKYQVLFWDAHTLHALKTPPALPSTFPKNVYLSFDIDALDSSIIPHTGTPVPGGLTWYESLNLIESLTEGRNVVGIDLVELAPESHTSTSRVSEFSAAYILYQILGITCKI